MLTEKIMRTGILLLLSIGGISLSTGCGGKITDAETRYNLGDAAITSGGTTTGTGGSGGSGGSGGTGDPDPTGGSGGGGATGSGGTTGTGGSGADTTGTTGTTGSGGSGTGTGGGSGDPGGTGGTGGRVADAAAGCPEDQPSTGTSCAQSSLVCNYDSTICTCSMSGGGGGGNRRDAAATSWACGSTMDAGRGGRGAY
jgi:hypothetical protein